MYSSALVGILFEVFYYYMKELENFFLVFVQIWQKMWFLVTLAPPGLPPLTQNLIFSLDILGRTPRDTHWVFFIIICNN